MSTHATIRTGLAAVVTGLSLTVSDSSDAADMFGTEHGAHRVAIAIDEAPGDEWDGTRRYVATLSAGHLRGCSEAAAQSALASLARSLRTAMLAGGALAAYDAQVVDAEADTITREGNSMILRQRYQIHAAE